jgi:hypothetical protein
MLHWALNGPHRVANYDTLSVSITTEHWTPQVRRSYAMNYGNGLLRREAHWRPRSRSLDGTAFWSQGRAHRHLASLRNANQTQLPLGAGLSRRPRRTQRGTPHHHQPHSSR